MTKNERKYFDCLKRFAWCVERACETGSYSSNLYDKLRKTIAEQERQHRRLAPEGHKHRFSVSEAVDYFTVSTIYEGRNSAETPLKEMRGVREDYLLSALIMSDPVVRERLVERLIKEFPGEKPMEVAKVLAGADYAFFTGSQPKIDEDTQAALTFAVQNARKS